MNDNLRNVAMLAEIFTPAEAPDQLCLCCDKPHAPDWERRYSRVCMTCIEDGSWLSREYEAPE